MEEAGAGDCIDKMFVRAEKEDSLPLLIETGAILSFPHTALRYAGPLQARVIVGLRRAGIEHVVALGVFHMWGHATTRDDYATAMEETEEGTRRMMAFNKLRGAFIPTDPICETPFGDLPLELIPPVKELNVRIDGDGLLRDEFSLDTFMSLLLYYYRMCGVSLPDISPIYIGMTRNPVSGSFTTAAQVAAVIRGLLSPKTAIVATGDLIHYGTVYTSPEMMKKMPAARSELTKYFRVKLERTLLSALNDRDYSEAFRLCDTVLNNDQRYLLPVIAEVLSSHAAYRIDAFELSDYTTILNVNAPCVVASALVAYVPEVEKR